MQDEHFMQQWTAGHSRFSRDLDRRLSHLGDRLSRRESRRKIIGDAYGIPTKVESGQSLSPGAQASLRGLAASVITVALWVIVMTLATPAPGLAASPEASVAVCQCLAHPPLA